MSFIEFLDMVSAFSPKVHNHYPRFTIGSVYMSFLAHPFQNPLQQKSHHAFQIFGKIRHCRNVFIAAAVWECTYVIDQRVESSS